MKEKFQKMFLYYPFVALILLIPNKISCVKAEILIPSETPSTLIAIEGMPGAGKTSIIFALLNKSSNQCLVLPSLHPVPGKPLPKSSATILSQRFHDWWVSRMKSVEKLSPYTKCVIFHRVYFTNLAYSYAYDNFLENKKYLADVHNKERYKKAKNGKKLYLLQKKLYERDLKDKKLDLIIVMDVSPELGLKRLHSLRSDSSWPWSEEIFLGFLKEFYSKELPILFKGKIIYINTDPLSLTETLEKVEKIIHEAACFEDSSKQSHINDPRIENSLIEFAAQYDLGTVRSPLINVFGYPTLYFRQHAVQMVNNTPQFFSVDRLNAIANNITVNSNSKFYK